MTTINCTEPCRFQKDGRCMCENMRVHAIENSHNCFYFSPKKEKISGKTVKKV